MKCIPIRSLAKSNNDDFYSAFRIRSLSDVLNGKDVSQEVHRHDFFFILYLQKGEGAHAIDFVNYRISNHCAFFTHPGQVHSITLNKKCEGYLIEFKDDFYFPGENALAIGSHFKFDRPTSARLNERLSSIHDEYEKRREGFREVIKSNLTIFFVELMRSQSTKPEVNAAVRYDRERLQDFARKLETDFVAHKDVSHYTDSLNLSSFQLNSITKKLTGKTAAQLINDRLILESKRNLLATSNQVNQIAYDLGYTDPSYFIRFFRKHTGYTPEAFRQKFG